MQNGPFPCDATQRQKRLSSDPSNIVTTNGEQVPSALLFVTFDGAVPGDGTVLFAVQVINMGPDTVTELRLNGSAQPLNAVQWTCMSAPGVCTPASSTGAANSTLTLEAGQGAQLYVSGTIPAGTRYVAFTGDATMLRNSAAARCSRRCAPSWRRT